MLLEGVIGPAVGADEGKGDYADYAIHPKHICGKADPAAEASAGQPLDKLHL